MPIQYHVCDNDFVLKGKGATSNWIKLSAHSEGFKVGQIAIVFCSDAHLLEINKQYLGHDYYTDIITFDQSDFEHKKIAGDLMISVDTVRTNAQQYGVSFEDELNRVIIHGILHLMGYKDKSPKDSNRMRAMEDKYLQVR